MSQYFCGVNGNLNYITIAWKLNEKVEHVGFFETDD